MEMEIGRRKVAPPTELTSPPLLLFGDGAVDRPEAMMAPVLAFIFSRLISVRGIRIHGVFLV
jgi:predicted Rossmann fold nucleotide-binding protein DprA/Smf involved in DNA uptake